MFFINLFCFTVGIIISLSQLALFQCFNQYLIESFILSPLSIIQSNDKLELFSDIPKIRFGKIYHQKSITSSSPLLSMTNGKPINEINTPMKITFRQSGGYAGLTKGCEVNTELLSPQEAKNLKLLVDRSGILEAQSKNSPNVADAYSYQIVIETVKQTYQVSFDEQNLPENVIPLIDFLEDCSDYIKQN